jgi:hypothetical protein
MKKIIVLIFLLLVISYAQIGRVTTAGWTTQDRQFNGPVYTRCRVVPTEGIHICWVAENGARYNFYDLMTHTLNWQQNGINPATSITGLGGMDYDPITRNAALCLIAFSGNFTPFIARDQSPGAGLFEYCYGPSGYTGGPIGVTNNEAIHIIMDGYYARIQPWGTWTTPITIAISGYGHNIAASKISNKVAILWLASVISGRDSAYYRLSNDGGLSWQPPVQIPFPPSSGLVPSFHSSSLFATFDNQDNLHIVASVAETSRTIPAEIWHYCPTNPQPWNLIHHYDAETLNAPVGYNALFATRPSIVQDPTTGYFFVTWEQFDSLNYEPLTFLSRADIWFAALNSTNQSVARKWKITSPNTTSKRFPIVGGMFGDTLVVSYLIDSIAGFANYGQGPTTNNPVVCQLFEPLIIGLEENSTPLNTNFSLDASPNPFFSHTTIRYALPAQSNVSLEIFDVTGRLIKNLVNEFKSPGVYTATWNGKNNNGIEVKSGVYFYALKAADKTITNKIIKTN